MPKIDLVPACLVLAASIPGAAWAVCEAPEPHTAREPGWCAGFAGNADADFVADGMPNEFFMAERGFSGAFLERERGRRRFLLGLDYAFRNYDADEEIGTNLDLYTLRLEPQWIVEGRRREWLLRLGVSRAVSSNLNRRAEVDRDQLSAAGALIARQPIGADVKLVVGIAHDRLFGSAHTYPMIGYEWQPGEDAGWQLGAVLPAPYARWRSGSWSGRLRLQPAGARWFVLDDDNGRTFDAVLRELRLSASLQRRLGARWAVEGTLGVSFDRRLSTTAGNGQRVAAELRAAPFGALSLIHRPE